MRIRGSRAAAVVVLLCAFAFIGRSASSVAESASNPLPLTAVRQEAKSYNCTPAAVAMVLQTLQAQRLIGGTAQTEYASVRTLMRAEVKGGDYVRGMGFDVAEKLVPALTNGQVEAKTTWVGDQEDWAAVLKTSLDAGYPVQIYVDASNRGRLGYAVGPAWGAHTVVVFGLNDQAVSYADPWDGQTHTPSRAEFAKLWGFGKDPKHLAYAYLKYEAKIPALPPAAASPSSTATPARPSSPVPSQTPSQATPLARPSVIVTPTPIAIAPTRPAAPTAVRFAQSRLLTWIDGSNNEDGFRIYQSYGGFDFSAGKDQQGLYPYRSGVALMATVAANVTSARIDVAALPRDMLPTTCSLWVVSFNAAGESEEAFLDCGNY